MGVIKATTLESLEMGSKSIYRKCLPGGPWQRLLPGIILLHSNEPTQEQRAIAALLYAGPDAVITGIEACRRQGLRSRELPQGEEILVLVPHQHKILSSEFVTVERTVRLPRAVFKDGIPLAPLIRATTDAARRIRTVEPIGQLLIEAIQHGRCTPKALAYELDHGTKRGTAIPRRLLAEWVNLRSIAEARAKSLSRRLEFQPSHWNTKVWDNDGNYVGCPDAWWEDVGLAWEIDSADFHFGREGYARTLERNTRYAAAGIPFVQTLPSRLTMDPDGVIAELRAAYRTAATRTRPPVYLSSKSREGHIEGL